MIDHLVERKELRRKGFTDPDNYLSRTTGHELQEAMLEEFRVKQIQREQEGGQWIEVRKGIRIFIRDGEDKDEKVERFKEKLKAAERINKPLRGSCQAKCFDE
jgi:hypothetical protein